MEYRNLQEGGESIVVQEDSCDFIYANIIVDVYF